MYGLSKRTIQVFTCIVKLLASASFEVEINDWQTPPILASHDKSSDNEDIYLLF